MFCIPSYKWTLYVLAFIKALSYPRISNNYHLAKPHHSPMIGINTVFNLQTEAQKVDRLA